MVIRLTFATLSYQLVAQFDSREQQDAVREYPSLAITGSPLHQKFMELYQEAKANRSELFRHAEAPLMLARQAATILREKANHIDLRSEPDPAEVATLGFPLQITAIFVPYSTVSGQTPPENLSDSETAKWQSENGYRLTVAAHFFVDKEGDIPPVERTKGASPVVEFLAQLAAACAAKDYRRVKTLSLPQEAKTVEKTAADPLLKAFLKGLIDSMPRRVPLRLRALLYVGKRLLVLYDLPGGEIGEEILRKSGGHYFIAEHLPEEYGIEAELFCFHLSKFLERPGKSPADIIVR